MLSYETSIQIETGNNLVDVLDQWGWAFVEPRHDEEYMCFEARYTAIRKTYLTRTWQYGVSFPQNRLAYPKIYVRGKTFHRSELADQRFGTTGSQTRTPKSVLDPRRRRIRLQSI